MPVWKHNEMLSTQFQVRPTLLDRFMDKVAELATLEDLDTGQRQQWPTPPKSGPPAQPQFLRSIHGSSQSMPRKTRTTLAQLCSGYSRTLASYLSRIDHTVKDECPDCRETPMTQHTSSAVPRSQQAWKWGPYGQTWLVQPHFSG